MGVDVGRIDASPIPANLGVSYRTSTTETHAKVAVSFVQSYFQVSVDPHTSPENYFAPGVTPADVDAALDDGDIPVYVRSVTYGRRVVAVFEDRAKTDSASFAPEIAAAYNGVQGEVGFTRTSTSNIQTTSFSAMVLGDDRVITSIDDLFAYLDEPADMSTAWPIAYTLQYLGSETPFSVGITTEVVTRTCLECGSSDDPYGKGATFSEALPIGEDTIGTIIDDDSKREVLQGGVLPPGQQRWFTFMGLDTPIYQVDPQAKLGTFVSGSEVCIFAKCDSGPTTPECLAGFPVTEGTSVGCCSTVGDAHLEGGRLGLCPEKSSDDALIHVRVTWDESASMCLQYDLTVHY